MNRVGLDYIEWPPGHGQLSTIAWPHCLIFGVVCRKTLPHDVWIFMCRYREMNYNFMHHFFSCYNIPLFLLLISPSAFALSDLCLQNTWSAYFILYFTFTRSKTIFKHVPPLLWSYWFFSPIPPIHISISKHVPSSYIFYFTPPCNNVAGEARPLSVVCGNIATIVLIFSSNSLDNAD